MDLAKRGNDLGKINGAARKGHQVLIASPLVVGNMDRVQLLSRAENEFSLARRLGNVQMPRIESNGKLIRTPSIL